MTLGGNCAELGNWKKSSQIRMKRASKATKWITEKYGEAMKAYEVVVAFENNRILKPRESLIIEYGYFFKSGNKEQVEEERVPPRILEICQPEFYKGSQKKGPAVWKNTDKCFIVNGMVVKQDANFEKNFFMTEIEDSGIFVGPYPSTDLHIKQM